MTFVVITIVKGNGKSYRMYLSLINVMVIRFSEGLDEILYVKGILRPPILCKEGLPQGEKIERLLFVVPFFMVFGGMSHSQLLCIF